MKTTGNKINQTLILTLTAMAILGMMGCSNNGSGTTVSPNYLTSGVTGTNYAGTATNCSGRSFSTSYGTMAAQAELYVSNGVANSNLVRVHWTGIPSDFNKASGTVAFWITTYDSSGNQIGQMQAPFYIEQYNGYGNFSTLNNGQEVSTYAVNNANLQGMDFVVDMSSAPTATVITASLYNSTSSSATHQLEILAPAFLANPNTYATNHPSILTMLHPLYAYASSAMSDAQYAQMAQTNYCF